MKNRFNNLSSKEWLPFQKSWSIVGSDEALYRDNLRFFTLAELSPRSVYYHGPLQQVFDEQARLLELQMTLDTESDVQFALIDIRKKILSCKSQGEIKALLNFAENLISSISSRLVDRRFICVLSSNTVVGGRLIPVSWQIGKLLANYLSLKDEKILCSERESGPRTAGAYVEYALYARKDDSPKHLTEASWEIDNFYGRSIDNVNSDAIPKWFVLKPPARKKGEVLHPAKYPESLADMFIGAFSEKGQNVLDPMSGTGSTQYAAVSSGRNGYGTELSPFFAELAINRLSELRDPSQAGLFADDRQYGEFQIIQDDARNIPNLKFPKMHYACTSPPYWDMLNMKGAENQARRLEKGLQTNYSDNTDDLGNVADYEKFLSELTDVYLNMFTIMHPGSFFTFVVKNIKKQGLYYPFAWDLSHRLLSAATVVSEHFWLQDDLSIAPYGYGNTWVSNTFHQYCITVQVT